MITYTNNEVLSIAGVQLSSELDGGVTSVLVAGDKLIVLDFVCYCPIIEC